MKLSMRRHAAAILATLVTIACSSDTAISIAPVAPPRMASADLHLDGVNRVVGLRGVQRFEALRAPVVVEATIGADGGELTIPAAGVTLTVPSGALREATKITMTARAGRQLAYDFQPHGLVFATPLILSQQLRGTSASLLEAPFFKLGYYEDPSLLGETTGWVSQTFAGTVHLRGWSFTANVPHFSGYLIGVGRTDSE